MKKDTISSIIQCNEVQSMLSDIANQNPLDTAVIFLNQDGKVEVAWCGDELRIMSLAEILHDDMKRRIVGGEDG